MKKSLLLVGLCLITLISFAQMPGMGGRPGGGQMPTGRFYGKVVDANNKGVDAASVTLVTNRMDSVTKKPKEVIVGGMLTNAGGEFSVENVPVMGRYQLKVTGIGYKAYSQPVAFEMPNRNAMSDPTSMLGALDKDLGNIKLEIDNQVLGGVTVTANKPLLQMGIDRKIFNVDRNLVSAGGTAVDVMKNVPSLNVDIDGNVTLRNNAPQIFVDGRPTNLTLEQIPADAIESVEIITNPSAKFDASGGTAGILNIVMKKNRRVGYSGNLRINADSRARVGGGGDINLRQNKINVFAGGNYFQRKTISTGTTERTNYGRNDTSAFFLQKDRSVGIGQFGFGRIGFDYFIDNRNTLTVNGTLARGRMEPSMNSDIGVDSLFGGMPYGRSQQYRVSNSSNLFRNGGAQASFKHNFPKAGHEWTADLTWNKGRNENDNSIVTDFYKMPGNNLDRTYNQIQVGSGSNENLVIQTDYAKPLSDKSKMEFGARLFSRKNNNANQFFARQSNGTLTATTENILFNSRDNVYAAYGTFTNRMKNFGYQLGLRAESSDYEGEVPTKNQSFNIEFPVSLFPSVFLTQKVKENDELQLNYSRRINRPNFFQLFPFVDSSDLLNPSVGNPGLRPEFTNSLELSYSKVFKKNRDNLIASLYYKNTTDLITRFQMTDTTISKFGVVNTFINANRSFVTGLELTSKNKMAKWWDLTSNLNLFTSRITVTGQPQQDLFPSYFLKVNNSFRLPKNFSIQLSGEYQSKIVSAPGGGRGGGGGGGMFGGGGMWGGGNTAAQGFIRPNYGVDFGVRYEFLKNRQASLSLNINDIFRTRMYNARSEALPFFVQDIRRRRDPQVVRLNFNWRFGKFDASLFKRKNTRADGNVDMGGIGM